MSSLKNKVLKKLVRPIFANWHRGTIPDQRARQERLVRFEYRPPDLDFKPEAIDSIHAEWIIPTKHTGTILYLHGGAFTVGSINTHRNLAVSLCKATGMKCLLIDYGLAPENPFPSGLKDVLIAYRWLLDNHIQPHEILIAGDSAGGGLTLAALLSLRDNGDPLPAGSILLSPWADLTLSGKSVETKASQDFILNVPHLKKMATAYAGEYDLTDPLISPVFADFQGIPPILIQVGTDEILLDDSLRIAAKNEKAGVDVILEIYEDMIHVFQMFPFFAETRCAFESIGKFCQNVRSKPDD